MIVILFTGGTISMKFDAAQGGAVPTLSGEEIVTATRGLTDVAPLEVEQWGRYPGPHMTVERMWALRNRIADEVRKAHRRPVEDGEDIDAHPDAGPSPLEEAVGREAVEAYERALESLGDTEREAIIARVEMGMSYGALAGALAKPSPDAARMTVSRALLRLAEEMSREQI